MVRRQTRHRIRCPSRRQALLCLAEQAPELYRAARGAAWLRRWLLRRAPDPAAASRALALASADDRVFCRRVRLDGWRQVRRGASDVLFELQDPHRDLLWPVALRAMILYAAGCPFLAPGASCGATDLVRHSVRVRRLAEPTSDAEYEVVVRPLST